MQSRNKLSIKFFNRINQVYLISPYNDELPIWKAIRLDIRELHPAQWTNPLFSKEPSLYTSLAEYMLMIIIFLLDSQGLRLAGFPHKQDKGQSLILVLKIGCEDLVRRKLGDSRLKCWKICRKIWLLVKHLLKLFFLFLFQIFFLAK